MPLSTSSSNGQWRFLLLSIGLFLAALATVVLCNRLINPLLFFRGPDLGSINHYKPEVLPYMHLVKPKWLAEQEPRTVILGSSTAAIGLDPDHPELMQPVFNYGMPGAGIEVLAELYTDVSHRKSPSHIVLALDFFGFNAAPSLQDVRDLELRQRLAPNDNAASQRRQDWFGALLSWRSLSSSLATVREQESINSGTSGFLQFNRNGHWQQTLAPNLSQRRFFNNIERQYMGRGWFPPPDAVFTLVYEDNSSLDHYAQLLKQLHRDDRDVLILISPLHARFQLAMAEVGLDDDYRDWKRHMLSINEQVAEEMTRTAFAVWDFADASELTRESIPAATDTLTRMRYFMDGHHYRPELGNMMLSRVSNPEILSADQNFGRLLRSADIEDHLATVEQRLAAYARANPQEIEELRRNRASSND